MAFQTQALHKRRYTRCQLTGPHAWHLVVATHAFFLHRGNEVAALIPKISTEVLRVINAVVILVSTCLQMTSCKRLDLQYNRIGGSHNRDWTFRPIA